MALDASMGTPTGPSLTLENNGSSSNDPTNLAFSASSLLAHNTISTAATATMRGGINPGSLLSSSNVHALLSSPPQTRQGLMLQSLDSRQQQRSNMTQPNPVLQSLQLQQQHLQQQSLLNRLLQQNGQHPYQQDTQVNSQTLHSQQQQPSMYQLPQNYSTLASSRNLNDMSFLNNAMLLNSSRMNRMAESSSLLEQLYSIELLVNATRRNNAMSRQGHHQNLPLPVTSSIFAPDQRSSNSSGLNQGEDDDLSGSGRTNNFSGTDCS
eukprot:CAMPEP_0197256730 /NCGR_PEP_ID=MMETSP1429-20130617/76364_1 /TAXON_ID=49237 /ORGANISM="Chaetoceros  sp., Strain UNC1202" /LENGTH=265 /DNA_ID=CAMNT_0042720381 /DNA_START=92 /DNA_END=889 /DNA_ORIENTATION=-